MNHWRNWCYPDTRPTVTTVEEIDEEIRYLLRALNS